MRAWEEFLKEQEKDLGLPTVEKWLRPLKVCRFDACNLYLEAPDSFKMAWFEEHIRHKVQNSLVNNNNKKIKVHLSASSETATPAKRQRQAASSEDKTPLFSLAFDQVDSYSTFDSFVACQSNLLAYKLLQEAAASEKGKVSFNPIYLFGRSGTGKTHLMMATASALRERGLNALYVRADTFTEHVVKAIRTGEMQTFRRAYRHADALLIDDLEIFSRKSATQEEFFHTFNTLHIEEKQIILSASSAPSELKSIEPRLISRFEWGIIVPLTSLPRQQMAEVLLNRAKRANFPLSNELVDFLLDTFSSSLKNLIRAFEALLLRTHLLGERGRQSGSDVESARRALIDLIDEEEKTELTPGKIIRTVAEYYGIRMDDILSKSQTRECALPRQIAMHLCRDKLNLPYIKIGDIFSRDHSTVMASVRQIQKGLEHKNHEIASSVKGVLNLLS